MLAFLTWSLAVIGGTSFWQTLWRTRVQLVPLHLSQHQFTVCSTTTLSYLQSQLCHPHCRPLLWQWHQSPSGSCALPSALSWQSAAPLLWSPRHRPCQTNEETTGGVGGREEEILTGWAVSGVQGRHVGKLLKKAQPRSWSPLTSLKASLSSFTPIIPAVSAKSFGVMRSTKSSKSTLPPTSKAREENATFSLCHQHFGTSDLFCSHPLLTPSLRHEEHSRFMLIFCPSSISSISVGM